MWFIELDQEHFKRGIMQHSPEPLKWDSNAGFLFQSVFSMSLWKISYKKWVCEKCCQVLDIDCR